LVAQSSKVPACKCRQATDRQAILYLPGRETIADRDIQRSFVLALLTDP
jgi:hypothetical protein